ncbi:PCNA-interacting partner-like [Antedon mediterranea]|uniref:PCNA-interacting partner-like n=1 Tax=Antedon mediterranea TaxID=105859 RepID=UPI003AF807F7
MEQSVYILKNDETTMASFIVQAILNKIDKGLIVIGEFENTENMIAETFESLSHYLIHIYRLLRLHKNERQTIYSEEDQLLATQLCMADYNREVDFKQTTLSSKYDLYDVATSEVLGTADHLNQDAIEGIMTTSDSVSDSKTSKNEYNEISRFYHEFLNSCNSVDLAMAYYKVKCEFLNTKSEETAKSWSKSKYLILQHPRNIIEASFLSLLCNTSGHYSQITVETHITTSSLATDNIEISIEETILPSCEEMLTKNISKCCATPNIYKSTSSGHRLSTTEIYFKRVFLSYLTLVVNTRDELALARCFNVPERDLDHAAFTALKREARQKSMPMCQTATSFVMKIRIGSKSYSADQSCQIAQYVKGLSEFVSLIQKLQVIIEEELNPSSALLRLVNQIKTTFLKAKQVGFNKEIIERVVRYLKLSIGKLSSGDSLGTPQKSVGNGGSMAGTKTIKLLNRLLDQEASKVASRVDVLCDGMASQGTPVRLPSLLSMFRSPAIASPDSPENQSLVERLLQKEDEQKLHLNRMGYRSCMMWADPKDLQKDQCVNEEYLRAINNECTQDTPRKSWKNTIWASDDNTPKNIGHNRIKEILCNEKNQNDTVIGTQSCNDSSNGVTVGETPKGRGKSKRQPFREINEQNVMKKAKSEKPKSEKPKKKNIKKTIPQIKGQKTLSTFFRA